jgi:predicted dehydrogenase
MKDKFTRRNFLKTAVVGAAGVAIFPSLVGCKKNAPDAVPAENGYVRRIGFIGLGQQAMHLLNGFLQLPGVEVVAGADVYGIKRERFVGWVTDFYKGQEDEALKTLKVDVYEDYHEILNRGDINTVVIATPDHTHAFIAIAACNAKKDIYLEKPLTFTIYEGQQLIQAVRKNNVVLASGCQQRSSPEFQHAVDVIQSGKLGKIKEVKAYVGAPPTPYDLPEEPIPSDLNWKAWLGPSDYVHYNSQLNPPISLNPVQNEQFWGAWRWYKELGGGFTTDWGAHMFDIAQWALGMDRNGPVKITPVGTDGAKFLTYVYETGTVLTEEPWDEAMTKGCKFIGENGWIEVARDYFNASNSEWLPTAAQENDGTAYETKIAHYDNFVTACRERKDPVVPVEIAHSSCTVCNLGNIAYDLNRSLNWDPKAQKFVNDPEADAKLTKTYAAGYSI